MSPVMWTVVSAITAPRLAVRQGMGDPDPVTMVIGTPPAGQDALSVTSLNTDALSVTIRAWKLTVPRSLPL